MGGAFTAFADDATALYFDPAALADAAPQVDVGGELVLGTRTYTPPGGPQQKASIASPAPSLGVVGRFSTDDQPSRVTFAAGVWNTGGGALTWPTTGQPAFDHTQELVLEATAGAALRVSDRLRIGGAIRLGLGLFSIDATANPFDAHLSASGVGVAMAWGALLTPTPTTRIAIAWRSPLRITTSGSGSVLQPGGETTQETVEHEQVWPQSATLGVGWSPAPRWKLAAQLDWTQWSAVDHITVAVTHEPAQVFSESWRDTWTARLGADYQMTRAVAVRAGAYVDTGAVPDRTLERQYLDATKLGVAAGATVARGRWRVDVALDLLPTSRTVADNSAETTDFPADRNKAPGEYRGTLATIDVSVGTRF